MELTLHQKKTALRYASEITTMRGDFDQVLKNAGELVGWILQPTYRGMEEEGRREVVETRVEALHQAFHNLLDVDSLPMDDPGALCEKAEKLYGFLTRGSVAAAAS